MTRHVGVGIRDLAADVWLDTQFLPRAFVLPQIRKFTQHQNLVDRLIGFRGRISLGGGNWCLPYSPISGTGTSTSPHRA
jgi:hypothetical protein